MQEKYNEESDKTRSTSDEVISLRAQVAELKQVIVLIVACAPLSKPCWFRGCSH